MAVPWKLWTEAGHEVVFLTETGRTPACDPLLLSGVLFGQLGAEPEPKAFYEAMTRDARFQSPGRWSELSSGAFDALHLSGGHAQGMRQYLGSDALAASVAGFWASEKPVSAICHGVLLLARAKGPSGKSVLFGHKTTCLPKYMERTAYYLTAWRHGRYYRTYDAYVEDEVRGALASGDDFVRGPTELTRRGTRTDDSPAFVVEDGRYVSARWPGDAYLFSKRLLSRL